MSEGTANWHRAELAAAALAVAPFELGGIVLRAGPGPVREVWLQQLRDWLPAATPWRRIPLHVSESRLLGGIDLAATLRAGAPVAESGLLAEADGGIAEVAMAERATRTTAAHLCMALDRGELSLERDGLRGTVSAHIAVVALDEGVEDEAIALALADRLTLRIDLHAVSIHDVDDPRIDAAAICQARARLQAVSCPPALVESLCATALLLGVESPRALILTVRLARVLAALRGRDEVHQDDARDATALALAHRATRLPMQDESIDDQEAEPPPEPPADPDDQPNEDSELPPTDTDIQPLPEQLLEATLAAMPPGLLAQLQAGGRALKRGRTQGKSGELQRHKLRGRPMGVIPGDPRAGARLNLVATLRAAAPWQKLRAAEQSGSDGGRARVSVRREDFRLVRYRQRAESTTIFVVDASGSSALHRLAEAKGAIELLLADCYVRRDQVALVAFRGDAAELLLPPTRSLVRAKRSLTSLPGGGGTPLASALDITDMLADQVERRGGTPCYVLLTDGRANISRDGTPGREQAGRDALASASSLKARQVRGMVIDTSPRPHRSAEELARALGANYLPLPHADAAALRDIVQAGTQ